MLFCFASLANLRALVPLPDGGYPGGNTAKGQSARLSNSSGTQNTASGAFALFSNTQDSLAERPVMPHFFRPRLVLGNSHGFSALQSNTVGAANISNTSNTVTGFQALFNSTTIVNNTAYGFQALMSNTTGSGDTAVGFSVLSGNTMGTKIRPWV